MAVKDGDRAELILRPGAHPETGEPQERTVKGVVRSFQIYPTYDPVTGKPIGKQETRWEISTDDPTHPAIGFDPKTAKFKG